MIPYGYGTLCAANAMLDSSAPVIHETTVIGKRHTSGKGARLELESAPWGTDPGGYVAANRALFDSVNSGSRICVYLRPGELGLPWYTIDHCPGGEV